MGTVRHDQEYDPGRIHVRGNDGPLTVCYNGSGRSDPRDGEAIQPMHGETVRMKMRAAQHDRWSRIVPEYFHKLPVTEQRLFEYFYIKKMTQDDIAELLGVTQGAVSSRLTKIKNRCNFFNKLKSFNTDKFDENLSVLFNPLEIEILRQMLDTTCQSETATRVNEIFNLVGSRQLNQVKVRHRFKKSINKLKKNGHPLYELFKLIDENLYIFHEVRLPQFYKEVLE